MSDADKYYEFCGHCGGLGSECLRCGGRGEPTSNGFATDEDDTAAMLDQMIQMIYRIHDLERRFDRLALECQRMAESAHAVHIALLKIRCHGWSLAEVAELVGGMHEEVDR